MRVIYYFSQVIVNPLAFNVFPALPAPSVPKVLVGIMYQTQNISVTPASNTSTGTIAYSRFL